MDERIVDYLVPAEMTRIRPLQLGQPSLGLSASGQAVPGPSQRVVDTGSRHAQVQGGTVHE